MMHSILAQTKLLTLDEALQRFIAFSQFRSHTSFAVITDRTDHSKIIQRRCSELIDEIPSWLFPKPVKVTWSRIEFANGSRLFFMNSCLQCKGTTLNAIALADHVKWSDDDLMCIIPRIHGDYKLSTMRFSE